MIIKPAEYKLENLEDFYMAPSGIGPLADQWKNKPHRLIYDLCREIKRLQEKTMKTRDGYELKSNMLVWVASSSTEIPKLRRVGEILENKFMYSIPDDEGYVGARIGACHLSYENAVEYAKEMSELFR